MGLGRKHKQLESKVTMLHNSSFNSLLVQFASQASTVIHNLFEIGEGLVAYKMKEGVHIITQGKCSTLQIVAINISKF